MLLLRGATCASSLHVVASSFQYMLLLRGATMGARLQGRFKTVSIHAPLARSNQKQTLTNSESSRFNTCSSCEEQHRRVRDCTSTTVSIHAPLARSNYAPVAKKSITSLFQYMLLLRGATNSCRATRPRPLFQYMLLLRGATAKIA